MQNLYRAAIFVSLRFTDIADIQYCFVGSNGKLSVSAIAKAYVAVHINAAAAKAQRACAADIAFFCNAKEYAYVAVLCGSFDINIAGAFSFLNSISVFFRYVRHRLERIERIGIINLLRRIIDAINNSLLTLLCCRYLTEQLHVSASNVNVALFAIARSGNFAVADNVALIFNRYAGAVNFGRATQA